MKTIVSLLLLIPFYFVTNAQESNVYLKGGLNIANISTTSDGRIDKANALPSFQVGIVGDLPFGGFLALQPGLLFTGKGAKTQTGQPGDAYYYKATSNPMYIELPVNLVVKLPLTGKQSAFFAGAGPYAAIGIAGKNKVEGNTGTIAFKSSNAIQYSNDDPSTFNEQEGAGLGIMRRFDFGLNGTAGLELDGLLLSVNYGYGLSKINSTASNDDDKNKHRVLSLSVGFRL